MIANYSNQKVIKKGPSLFLAGPTPRNENVTSWRPQALEILNDLDFSGIVYVPEDQIKIGTVDHYKHFLWEQEALENADLVVFWVPRKLPDMPAFSTNVEFGYWLRTKKVIYGRPDDAEHIGYLDKLYKFSMGKTPVNDLEQLLKKSVSLCSKLHKSKK